MSHRDVVTDLSAKDRPDWTAWQGDKQVSCPAIHPDVDEQCSLGNGHGEAHRVTIYWDNEEGAS